ncbi:Organic cation transporter protein [Eumeta japonica]|uniref:Organic cation transporter protein n=1 Tax=Eumeta variegata TaxID=151549 RepID=A0A4C1Z6F4_EUMVA|nr:Organic cation transporter protein [Eumeta japonica]
MACETKEENELRNCTIYGSIYITALYVSSAHKPLRAGSLVGLIALPRPMEGREMGTDDVQAVMEKFGKFQIIQYTLVCLPVIFISMTNVNYVFVAGEVGYRCEIEECIGSNSTPDQPMWWRNSTDECRRPVLDRQKYELRNGTCSEDTFTNLTEECTRWVYESRNSIFAEMNLACQTWKSVLVGVVHNLGMLVSMVLVGWLADRLRRGKTRYGQSVRPDVAGVSDSRGLKSPEAKWRLPLIRRLLQLQLKRPEGVRGANGAKSC